MKTLFDFFEELDEMIYISDMDTHELVYMNRHLRELLGYPAHESYQGKPCYAVLQNGTDVCPFCNNADLKPGKYVTWIHENPILKQKVIIKDSMLVSNGHSYRVEIAVQAETNRIRKENHFYTRSETLTNECLQYFLISPSPEESMEQLLAYLGETFQCDRAYIFEFYNNATTSNTYEWCSANVSPQKEILQGLSIRDIGYWITAFNKNQMVILRDLEEIRTVYPSTYSLLQPQGISSLIAAPIFGDGLLKGFIGLDNPGLESLPLIEQVLEALCPAIAVQFNRRNLYKRFNEMSYQDPLTGAYNRNAMIEHSMHTQHYDSFAAVYCDINGLKAANDTLGHDAGNKLIQACYDLLKTSLHTPWIYRIGGDEFVALYYNTGECTVIQDIDMLKLAALQSVCQISVGYAWSDQHPLDMDHIINQADAMMYEEKDLYYQRLESCGERPHAMTRKSPAYPSLHGPSDFQTKLQRFLANTYCDVTFLLAKLSDDNSTSYFYFGDIQKNIYFISDNMREKFGFEDNIVPDLLHQWASRIKDPTLLETFWMDIDAMFTKKKSSHDLRYPIADAAGSILWIRCIGEIKWSEDGTTPLFFAGQITRQDESFIVDSLTNFPTEIVLTRYLNSVSEQGQRCQVIGFSFNHMTQINNKHGRRYGDDLLREISGKLYKKLSSQLRFYRLNGMRCIALMDSASPDDAKQAILQIKGIIEQEYQHIGLMIQDPCSFALLSYPQDDASPQDFIENIISLIKISQQNPALLYVDNSNGNIQQLQKLTNLEMRLIEDILNGMANFRIVIQPIVSSDTGRPISGETLLRWCFEGENISPAVFIPIIEKNHMMYFAGRWVFEQAVRSCIRILSHCPDFYLNVNVSLQQLNDRGFIDFIKQTLDKYNLDGRHIILEMTESCMDEQPEELNHFVKACAAMGIRTALDDFGSGYSSLRVLLQYPSSIIKLDRTLLLEMSDSIEKSNFITSIVYACHQFGKKVCIEGIETAFQNELVKEAGCDMIQGFYYYRPMEIDQVYKLLSTLDTGTPDQ